MSSEGELTGTENFYKFVLSILLLTFGICLKPATSTKNQEKLGGGGEVANLIQPHDGNISKHNLSCSPPDHQADCRA